MWSQMSNASRLQLVVRQLNKPITLTASADYVQGYQDGVSAGVNAVEAVLRDWVYEGEVILTKGEVK